MNFNDFATWDILGTYAGSLGMVLVLTQLTKGLPVASRMPTQLWSYLLALLVLYTASFFTARLTLDRAVLILFNAALVSLGANGGFDAVKRILAGLGGGQDA